MPAIYLHCHTVGHDEIDEQGHAGNLAYLRWMQDAALAHSAAQGWPAEAYRVLGGGWVVRSHEIRYLQPSFAGDEIVIETWVATMKRVSSLRRYRVVRTHDEVLLASAATEWAFIDYTRRAPARIPPQVATAFELVER